MVDHSGLCRAEDLFVDRQVKLGNDVCVEHLHLVFLSHHRLLSVARVNGSRFGATSGSFMSDVGLLCLSHHRLWSTSRSKHASERASRRGMCVRALAKSGEQLSDVSM